MRGAASAPEPAMPISKTNAGLPGAFRLFCRSAISLLRPNQRGPPNACFVLDSGPTATTYRKGAQTFLREDLGIEPRPGASAIELSVTAVRAWAVKNNRLEFLLENNIQDGIPMFAARDSPGFPVWHSFVQMKLTPLTAVLKDSAQKKKMGKMNLGVGQEEISSKQRVLAMKGVAPPAGHEAGRGGYGPLPTSRLPSLPHVTGPLSTATSGFTFAALGGSSRDALSGEEIRAAAIADGEPDLFSLFASVAASAPSLPPQEAAQQAAQQAAAAQQAVAGILKRRREEVSEAEERGEFVTVSSMSSAQAALEGILKRRREEVGEAEVVQGERRVAQMVEPHIYDSPGSALASSSATPRDEAMHSLLASPNSSANKGPRPARPQYGAKMQWEMGGGGAADYGAAPADDMLSGSNLRDLIEDDCPPSPEGGRPPTGLDLFMVEQGLGQTLGPDLGQSLGPGLGPPWPRDSQGPSIQSAQTSEEPMP